MTITRKMMYTIVFFSGTISFILGVISDIRKVNSIMNALPPAPADDPDAMFTIPTIPQVNQSDTGTPNEIFCQYPEDPVRFAYSYVSVAFLVFSTTVGFLALFYPYDGIAIPKSGYFASTRLILFAALSLLQAGIAATLLLWPTIQDQYFNKFDLITTVDDGGNPVKECPVAITGLLGGGAFIALNTSFFWMVSLMLAKNAREDFLNEGLNSEFGSKSEHSNAVFAW